MTGGRSTGGHSTGRRRGRPPKTDVGASPDAILDAALEMLDRDGADALTMRALARRVGTTPMAIYHHFGDRNGLVKALAERAYAGIAAPEGGPVRARIGGLLRAYHAAVVRHPGLALTIFRIPAVFPDQARRISDELMALLRGAGLPPGHARLWLHILVDVTHGAALATAMGGTPAAAGTADYAAALAALLDALPVAAR